MGLGCLQISNIHDKWYVKKIKYKFYLLCGYLRVYYITLPHRARQKIEKKKN